MKAFDETYADQDFERALTEARQGWMSEVPRASQPDLGVEGLSGTLIGRLVGLFAGRRQ